MSGENPLKWIDPDTPYGNRSVLPPPPPNKYDVVNRPAGCEKLKTFTTFSSLQHLAMLILLIETDEVISDETLDGAKDALAVLLRSSRTAFNGEHPDDICTAVLTERPPGTVVSLPEALRDLAMFVETQLDMPGQCTFTPRRGRHRR